MGCYTGMNNNNIQVWRLNTAKANFQLGSIGVEPMASDSETVREDGA